MPVTKQIKTALISVFHKDGLDELLATLHAQGVKFLSTGGTQHFYQPTTTKRYALQTRLLCGRN